MTPATSTRRAALTRPGIGDVALGGTRQALEPVARPGRNRLDDEQVGEQAIVGCSRLGVDADGVVDGLVLHDSGRARGQRFEVAPQPHGVAAAGDLRRIARQDLFEVAVQPASPGRSLQVQDRGRERTGERRLHIASQVRWVGRDPGGRLNAFSHDALEEPGLFGVAEDLTADQPGQGDSGQPRARPCLSLDIGADRARQQEAAGPRIVVHGPLERSQDRRHRLPLVQKHGLMHAAKGHIRIGAERSRLGVAVEPDDRASVTLRRGGLADRAWTHDKIAGSSRRRPGKRASTSRSRYGSMAA